MSMCKMSPESHSSRVGFLTIRYDVTPWIFKETDMVRNVIRVLHNDVMRVVSGVQCQKFGNIIHNHVINTTLHRAKQVMIKLWHTYCLVEYQ